MRPALEWHIATVKSIKVETPNVKTLTLEVPGWIQHRPGQHYDVRLTAPDGYQAQRSYSIASEPERVGEIDLTVERLVDGEVSSYLHDVLLPGDQIEVRGPIGGYFVWEASMGGPLLLIAGGSGIVPLMSIIRHRTKAGSQVPTRLLYSVRTPDDVIYFEELMQRRAFSDGLEIFYTFTRSKPPDWNGYARRIDGEMLREVIEPFGKERQRLDEPVEPFEQEPLVFICGPTLMVESVANHLVQIGISPAHIRTERFGPTGGTL